MSGTDCESSGTESSGTLIYIITRRKKKSESIRNSLRAPCGRVACDVRSPRHRRIDGDVIGPTDRGLLRARCWTKPKRPVARRPAFRTLPTTISTICGGNDRFWNTMSGYTFGAFDLLKSISSHPSLGYSRANRRNYLGLVNEPCFEPPTAPNKDRRGLWLDVTPLAKLSFGKSPGVRDGFAVNRR